MPTLSFDEDQQRIRSNQLRKKTGSLSGLIIKLGLAKDEAGAGVVLLFVAVVAVLIGAVVWWSGSAGSANSTQTKYELGAPIKASNKKTAK